MVAGFIKTNIPQSRTYQTMIGSGGYPMWTERSPSTRHIPRGLYPSHKALGKYKKESKILKKMIRKAKRACWSKFIEEQGWHDSHLRPGQSRSLPETPASHETQLGQPPNVPCHSGISFVISRDRRLVYRQSPEGSQQNLQQFRTRHGRCELPAFEAYQGQAMHLALTMESSNMIAVMSDSRATIQTVHNLNKGLPPRSGIEANIKRTLSEYASSKDVRISWVQGNFGIEGNEKADQRACFESHLGELSGRVRTVTHGAKSWLHHIGKAESRDCPCGTHGGRRTHYLRLPDASSWGISTRLGDKRHSAAGRTTFFNYIYHKMASSFELGFYTAKGCTISVKRNPGLAYVDNP
ncbi:hypothetical protein L211DRAFT_302099 [Terfezia boudieri ATCC MYA-4762]|uniref:RNase H type-1 domain-containing protein n=1 Tax=Terfezia boudieri ATCC MYA-4762 TaxID=1051890 RepID=A0A3N4LMP5_9PEZI|nr:hypothetical protein L211DRAFT_302099 [Terfezia boudieri ATCC MYA-4762]